MKRNFTKILRPALLLLLMLLMLVAPTVMAASSSELDALEDLLAAATSQREAAEKAVTSAKTQLADAMTTKKAIDTQIHALEVEIEATERVIANYEIKISIKNDEIAAMSERLDRQYAVVRDRIRAKREEGGLNYLTIILESDGMTEFFCGIERFRSMLDYDSQLLDSYRDGITSLEGARADIEHDRSVMEEQLKSLETRRGELQSARVSAQELITSAESDMATAAADVERLTAIEAEYEEKRVELLAELQKKTNSRYVGGEFVWPLPEKYTTVSSGFGPRIHPVTGKWQHHNGIDIPAPYGTEIYACNDGTVIECSYNYADGYYVTVDHGGGVATFYSHISRYRVTVGEKVTRGQVIANVGTSGYTTGAHLNLNVYKDGAAVGPMTYFK